MMVWITQNPKNLYPTS